MVRANPKEKWSQVEEEDFMNEAQLQDLLVKHPDLVPVDVIDENLKPIAVSIPEAGLPGSGRTDLIGIDEEGNITIIETKLAASQEIKRTVIGQILEYAAFLWRMSYEEFDAIVVKCCGKHLTDLMASVEKDDDDWSAEVFREAVAANLRQGLFNLCIVVDGMNEELRRIVDFINAKPGGELRLYALELKYFRSSTGEVALPQMYGTSGVRTATSKVPAWDEQQFLASAEDRISDERERARFLDLYEWLKHACADQKWGRGKDVGRVAFRFACPVAMDGRFTLLRLRSDGRIKLGFGRMARELPQDLVKSTMQRFPKLVNNKGLKAWIDSNHQRPDGSIRLGWPGSNRLLRDMFPDEESLKNLKDGVKACAEEFGRLAKES